jgi:hypothetical protein
MTFCPQFELSLTNNEEVFHFFHRTFGLHGCMAVCGSLFLGSGALFSSYILNFSELEKIYSSKFLYYFAMSGVFISTFLIFGADIYIDLALAWVIGSVISGILVFSANQKIRVYITAK